MRHSECNKAFLNRNYTAWLRGICIILIVFSHTASEFEAILSAYHLTTLLQAGWIATGVFFFLSGYGLTLSIRKNNIDRTYIWTHLKRLLFPYLIFWGLYIITGLLVGHFPTEENLIVSFLSLKMPNADSWFFRTILVIYLLYMIIARFQKRYAGMILSVTIVIYAVTLAISSVAGWWWNTICCFPVGMAFARNASLQRPFSWTGLAVLGMATVVCYKIPFLGSFAVPVLFSIFCAELSVWVHFPKTWHFPVLIYTGTNSLYMYLLESIPIGFFPSERMGLVFYVVGGILTTIILTYIGKSLENRFNRV